MASPYGRLNNCQNFWRPGNRVNVHCIAEYVSGLRKDLGFRKDEEVIRWLKSDEIAPYWREFVHDYWEHNPLYIATESPETGTAAAFNSPIFKPDINLIDVALVDWDTTRRLVKDSERKDKSEWELHDHIAWFVHQVFYAVHENRGPEAMFPKMRNTYHCDRTEPAPFALSNDLVYVFVALAHIEVRRPGWVYDGNDDESV